ncbi:MAG TPA: RcnB family protein [Sphingomonas sp.]|nr:RcnB family protein [Sphingomonas sp.]
MRSLWIATLTATALVPAAASAQSVARSGAMSGPGTFAGARAGAGGAFSQARSAPPMAMQHRGGGSWNGPRAMPPVRGGGAWSGANSQARSGSWSRSWSGPRGTWTGQRWTGGSRWGNRIDGRWAVGGWAPGGWDAYRRPTRGWVLPSYWFAPGYYINDFAFYGLGAPPVGYNWSRYYDDAVLVDGRGRVFDSVSGIDWNRYDGAAAYDDYAYDDGDTYYADGVDDDYAPRGRDRRDTGVGGAVIGGVVGGVAGNVIAGRGNRLGGTLIGAGVGAVAGAAIDRAEDRGRDRRYYDDRRYDDRGAPYGYPDRPLPPPPGTYPPPPPPGMLPPPPVVHHGGGYAGGYETRVYSSGGYGYYGGTTTTVTVMPTTTETVETITVYDDVRTTRHVYRKPKAVVRHRAPTKIIQRSKILSR